MNDKTRMTKQIALRTFGATRTGLIRHSCFDILSSFRHSDFVIHERSPAFPKKPGFLSMWGSVRSPHFGGDVDERVNVRQHAVIPDEAGAFQSPEVPAFF